MRDQSATALGWTPPAPVAKTQGFLIGRAPATAEIISVRASDASTILTWQLSAPRTTNDAAQTLETHGLLMWPGKVRLVDAVAQKSYGVNTTHRDRGTSVNTYCVCSSYLYHVGPKPVRMTAEYPALAAGVTSISVRIPDFAPVTVPVTRN
jgi:hypothetical protein